MPPLWNAFYALLSLSIRMTIRIVAESDFNIFLNAFFDQRDTRDSGLDDLIFSN